VLREMMEIMISRCEYVDEFASVQEEIGRPAKAFLEKVERVYRLAAAAGELRSGLDALDAARDTWVFISGLIQLLLNSPGGADYYPEIPRLVAIHMALRKRPEVERSTADENSRLAYQ